MAIGPTSILFCLQLAWVISPVETLLSQYRALFQRARIQGYSLAYDKYWLEPAEAKKEKLLIHGLKTLGSCSFRYSWIQARKWSSWTWPFLLCSSFFRKGFLVR